MDHEQPPAEPDEEVPVEQPKEWPEPTQSDIDEMEQEERAREVYEREKRTRELIDSTKKMIEMSEADEARRRAAMILKPDPIFDIPPAAQKEITAKQDAYSEDFDREDAASTPQTMQQIREKLTKEGSGPIKTAEEIEEEEVRRISAHAAEVHKPRIHKSKVLKRTRYASPRDTGPPPHIAKEMRDN